MIAADDMEIEAIESLYQVLHSKFKINCFFPTDDRNLHLENKDFSHWHEEHQAKYFYIGDELDLSEMSLILKTFDSVFFVGISTSFSYTFWNIAEILSIPKIVWVTETHAERLFLRQNTSIYLNSMIRNASKIVVSVRKLQDCFGQKRDDSVILFPPIQRKNMFIYDEIARKNRRDRYQIMETSPVILAQSNSDDFTELCFCLESFYLFWLKNSRAKLILIGPAASSSVIDYMIKSLGLINEVRLFSNLDTHEESQLYSMSDLLISYEKPTEGDSPIPFSQKIYCQLSTGLPVLASELTQIELVHQDLQPAVFQFSDDHISANSNIYQALEWSKHCARVDRSFQFQQYILKFLDIGGKMLIKELDQLVQTPALKSACGPASSNPVQETIDSLKDEEFESLKLSEEFKSEILSFFSQERPFQADYKLLCAAGMVYLSNDSFHLAEKKLQEASALNEDFYPSFLYLGKCYLRIQIYDKAMKNFRKALALHENCAAARFGIGMVYLKLEMYDESMTHLSQNVQKNIHHHPSILALCRCVSEHPEPNKAITVLEEISEWTDQEPHVLLALSQLYRKCGQADVGQILLDQALGE